MKYVPIYCLLVLLLTTVADLPAQTTPDSLQHRPQPWGAYAAVGAGALCAAPTAWIDHRFRQHYENDLPHYRSQWENVLQYAPLATLYALKACGVESRSSLRGMALETACAGALMVGSVKGLKALVHQQRPDGWDRHTFPSGHAAVSMMSARLLDYEYGQKSPWISAGAYSCALLVSALRVRHHHHWGKDVLLGAGLGWMAAEIGCRTQELLLSSSTTSSTSFPPYNPYTGWRFLAVNVNTPLLLGKKWVAGQLCQAVRGIQMEAEAAFAPMPTLGFGGKIGRQCLWGAYGQQQLLTLDCLTLAGGVYTRKVIAPQIACHAKVLVGADAYLSPSEVEGKFRGCAPAAQAGIGIEWQCGHQRSVSLNADYGWHALPHHHRPLSLLQWGIGLKKMF